MSNVRPNRTSSPEYMGITQTLPKLTSEMVQRCMQERLAASGDPYNDDPITEDQMEALQELFEDADEWMEANQMESGFELVWACIWQLEYDAAYPAYRKCDDKKYLKTWTTEAEDLLVRAAQSLKDTWSAADWQAHLQKLRSADRYKVAFQPGAFFRNSFPRLQQVLR